MKTIMKLIAALLIAAMMMSGAALAAGKIKTTGEVNVRTGAGLDYASRGTVKKGTVLSYDETKKDGRGVKWYHITNGKGGWVSSKYAAQASDKAASAREATKVRATGGDVNVRKGPGLGYADIGTLKKGDAVKFLGETSRDSRGVTWYRVANRKGQKGWVSSKYTSLIK